MNSILKNQTWDLVPSLVNCKPMGLKWAFKVKKNSKREVMRQKSQSCCEEIFTKIWNR